MAGEVKALVQVMQTWAEVCRQRAAAEVAAAMRWYLLGRADAHEMDARRAREVESPTVSGMPPEQGLRLTQAYEVLMDALCAASSSSAGHRDREDEDGRDG